MLKISVPVITPRIQYVFDIIKDFRKVNVLLSVCEHDESENYIYAPKLKDNQKGLVAATLLFEEELYTSKITSSSWNDENCLAFNEVTDPLASIFYHITRMEEYGYENYDEHGRFQTKDSFVSRFGWKDKLLVERWIDAFLIDYEQQMSQKIDVEKSPLTFLLTFDIDNTFAFKWKSWSRILGSYWKDIWRLDWKRMKVKTKVLLNLQKDPFDTFDKMQTYQEKGINVRLFWLLGDISAYDRNVSNSSRKHLNFIRQLRTIFPIGLHPSYLSNNKLEQLSKEKQILDNTLENKTITSRQHFLKLKFPDTYQRNIQIGLKEDFTLGFGDELGFRAGTLRPFYFFDLTTNRPENYLIHPFAYMDGTLKEYQKWSVEQSKIEIQKLIQEALLFGGEFSAIWHNETISDWDDWKEWSSLIEFTNTKIHEAKN